MKNKMARGLTLVAGIVLAVMCWWTAGVQGKAAGYTVSGLKNIGMVNSDFLGNGVDHSALIYWYMNGTGKISYCLQYGYRLSSGQEFTTAGGALTSMTEEQIRQLRYCLYFGYQAGGYGICPHGAGYTCQEEWIPYAATQAMVWLIVAGKYEVPGAVAQWGRIVADATDYPDRVWAEYEELYAEMEASMKMEASEFASTNMNTVPTHTMKWDSSQGAYTVTVTDETGVMSLYNWTLPTSVSAVRYGNQITFSTTQELEGELVKLSAKPGSAANREVSTLIFLQPSDAGKQNQIQYGSVTYDPVNAWFYLKTGEKYGTCRMRKLDSVTGNAVGGAVYGMYADSSCTDLVTTVTIGGSGEAVSEEVPAATYYVKEITAPAGYHLNRTVYRITVEAGKSTDLEVANVPTRYRFVKMDDQGRVLPGCEFELLDAVGNVLDKWVTGVDGVYELTGKLIEGASYTLREVDCPLGYVRAKDYSFTVSSERDWVEVITTNARIEATVTVKKCDSDGNWADGTEFLVLTTRELFGAESFDYQGKTYFALQTESVSNGSVHFDGLEATGADEYLVVETKSLSGMQLLAEPIRIGTLPVAAANGVNGEYTGRIQTKDGVTYLYDLTYNVANSKTMVLPLTGEVDKTMAAIPVWCVATALMTVATGRKRKRRRKG